MIYFVAKNLDTFVGSAVVALDVVESLVLAGKKVKPICLKYSIPDERSELFSSIEPLQMPNVPQWEEYTNVQLGRLKYLFRSLQCKFNTFRLSREVKPSPGDLMIFNGYKAPTRNVFNQFEGRFKTVQIVHVSPTFIEKFEGSITVEKLLEMYQMSECLVFVSDECRKEWLSYGLLDDYKTHYIPNCAQEEVALKHLSRPKNESRKKLGLEPDRFYLVSVASLLPTKGQDLLIDAASELKRIAPNLEILIIGTGETAYTEKLEEKVSSDGIDYITFLGRKSNAMEYIYASDTFILMSRAEALPVVILESMILKTPVIASNIDGVPEMVVDGETGLLFESDNINELKDAFEKLYNDMNKRAMYAEKASERYWRSFSKELFRKRYVELVESL